MTEITVKATVTSDHKLTAVVPDDVPAGEVEVVVRTPAPGRQGNARAVAAALLKASKSVKTGRTREEIDAELAAFRDEWE